METPIKAPTTIARRPPYELGLLVLVVVGIYFTRISDPPLVGEEPRWACGAEEMLRTGDWIVPRQQGHVFPERPPLGSWVMALTALVRGSEVDVLAIRLPSLIAMLLTCLVIYAYARSFLSRWGALASGLVYATFGHVLQIGRLGESEALFTLFVGGALLVWHLGYSRGWSSLAAWSAGYSLAALGALVKGPQAPVYFVVVTSAYLIVRREWGWLLNWRHAVGIGLFAAIVGAWQIPFYLATDWAAVQAVWGGLAGDRYITSGLVKHIVAYPLEIAVCLLPWSPLLVAFVSREFRASLGDARPMVLFLATAIIVTFPSVLLAALARGRYFMPLFPCFAVLIGMVLERLAAAGLAAWMRRGWRVFLQAWSGIAVAVGVAGVVATFTTIDQLNVLDQPAWFALLFAALACAAAGLLMWSARPSAATRVPAAVLTLVIFAGLFRVGFMSNVETIRNNPVYQFVREAKELLPEPEKLVSFGPVDHRFVYFYRQPVEELEWPLRAQQIPPGVTYFCMNRFPDDTPESRANGRGRTSHRVPGTLPVAWEQVAEIPVDRRHSNKPHAVVVIGKIVRSPERGADETSPNRREPAMQAERPTTPRRSS